MSIEFTNRRNQFKRSDYDDITRPVQYRGRDGMSPIIALIILVAIVVALSCLFWNIGTHLSQDPKPLPIIKTVQSLPPINRYMPTTQAAFDAISMADAGEY